MTRDPLYREIPYKGKSLLKGFLTLTLKTLRLIQVWMQALRPAMPWGRGRLVSEARGQPSQTGYVESRVYVSCFRHLVRNTRCNTMSHLTADASFFAHASRAKPRGQASVQTCGKAEDWACMHVCIHFKLRTRYTHTTHAFVVYLFVVL